jgi:predicted ferric reductase
MKKKILYSLYFLNLAIILYYWWSGSALLTLHSPSNIVLSLGKLAGLLAAFFILMQFVLMGRATWLEQLFGLDKLARVHQQNGKYSICFILLHPILITIAYAASSKMSIIDQFLTFMFEYDDLLKAGIAVLFFCIVVVSSIYTARLKLKFETWYYIHLITYIAVLFAWGHQLVYGEDFLGSPIFTGYWYLLYIAVFGNVLLFRFLTPLYNFYKYRFALDHIIPETDTVNSVYITGRNLESFKVKPGQFVIVRFLTKGYYWDAHPFSISAVHTDSFLRLSIKAVGDFTQKISAIPRGTKVLIEGPYGIFTKEVSTSNKLLFIAGGIGITPIRALLEECVKNGKDCVLLYGNRNTKDIAFKKEFEDLQAVYPFQMHHILSEEDVPGQEKGFVDKAKIEKYVSDYPDREVFLCGPPIMMQKIRAALAELHVPESKIHFELFSLK